MGYTSKWQIHTVDDHFLTAFRYYDDIVWHSMMYCKFHHWPWHMGHTSLAIGLRLPGSSLLKLPHHSGRSPAARAPGPKWASLSIRQIACSLTTVTEVARLTSPTFQILDASWWYSLTLLENLCLHSETVWKFWWAVLRFSGWVGQTVSEYRRLGDRQFQIFLDKYSSLWGTVQWSEIPKWIGSSDIDVITHLQYDKLWGLPRRVFTLFNCAPPQTRVSAPESHQGWQPECQITEVQSSWSYFQMLLLKMQFDLPPRAWGCGQFSILHSL